MRTEHERRVLDWHSRGLDKTLRLEYDLDERSVVLDVGGYEGQWASDIFAMYRCRIHVFEPVASHAAKIARRFERNPLITVHAFGLAREDGSARISLADDQSSVLDTRQSGASEEVRMVGIGSFAESEGLTHIDLMKINIEGGEYDLLEHLLDSGRIQQFRNVQVQFHDFFPAARERRMSICERLVQTHHRTYAIEFVWENWERNSGSP
jgi:FkbM family methyltransferase